MPEPAEPAAAAYPDRAPSPAELELFAARVSRLVQDLSERYEELERAARAEGRAFDAAAEMSRVMATFGRPRLAPFDLNEPGNGLVSWHGLWGEADDSLAFKQVEHLRGNPAYPQPAIPMARFWQVVLLDDDDYLLARAEARQGPLREPQRGLCTTAGGA